MAWTPPDRNRAKAPLGVRMVVPMYELDEVDVQRATRGRWLVEMLTAVFRIDGLRVNEATRIAANCRRKAETGQDRTPP